ncbi:hypothetical protein [Polaromonas sp.]|uniref:hypothetical protein n=1 Tax=Polaromonas sp. TaxID=1869339 RepID=UPI003CB19E17
MSEALQIALFTAVANGLVTWGVVSTKLAWLRRDVEKLEERLSACESRHYHRRHDDP